MKKGKTMLKLTAVLLSLLILLTVMPMSTFAADTFELTASEVTSEEVAVGTAPVYDLNGGDYAVSIPDATQVIDRSAIADSDNRVRSEEGDSLNTTVVDNLDGTHTMTLYDYPVKFVNSAGEIEDISLEITSAGGGAYKTKASNIQTVFPKRISEGIRLSGNGVNINLKPVMPVASSRNASAYGLSLPTITDSTVTKLDNETVSYYYDNNTTFEYSLTYTGFKEDIVVAEYTGKTEYTFLLNTGGLTLTEIDGSYYLTDVNGEIKATVGDIIIFTADERNNTMGTMTHVTVKENEQYMITIHVDADYLKDENTVYPIRIDPTIEITYDSNGSSAIQDVTINSTAGSSGTSGSLYVGKRNTYGISRTLMKFPGLNLSSIPSNSTINSAYIEIRDLMCETTEMTVNACIFIGNDWDESTANWSNTNPNLYTTLSGGSVSVSYSNGTSLSPNHRYSINITRAVKLWKSGLYSQTKGILLKASDSVENGGSALYKTFASYNRASNKPSLKINYTSNVTHTAYGWLDFANSSVIKGWVWCSNHPSESLDVVLTITNTATAQAWRTMGTASTYRADVAEAGFGTGNYGFSCSMGDWLEFPQGEYSVSAQAVLPNGEVYMLHASPKTYYNDVIHLEYPDGLINYLLVGNRMTLQYNYSGGDHTIAWSTSDSGVASVNTQTGLVVAKAVGTVVITATLTNSSTGEVRTSSKTIYVRDNIGIVNNAAYYIMNCESGQYLSVSGTSVMPANRAATASNKWTLSIQEDKKYNLANGASTANNILNVSGSNFIISSNNSAINLIGTEDFTLYRLVDEGLYCIRYKEYFVTQENNSIILSYIPTDGSYWSLMQTDKHTANVVSFTYLKSDSKLFDSSEHDQVFKNAFENNGYTAGTNNNITPSAAYSLLQSSDVFCYIGHGGAGQLLFFTDGDTPTGSICANSYVAQYGSLLISSLDENALASSRCVLYLGCHTGSSSEVGSANIVDETYNKGAHFVLGVTVNVEHHNIQAFANSFYSAVANGKNIYDCIQDALKAGGDDVVLPNGEKGQIPLYYVGDSSQYLD